MAFEGCAGVGRSGRNKIGRIGFPPISGDYDSGRCNYVRCRIFHSVADIEPENKNQGKLRSWRKKISNVTGFQTSNSISVKTLIGEIFHQRHPETQMKVI